MSSPAPIIYLTAIEAAAVLRISPAHVVSLCRDGHLRANKPGKLWLISEADLRDYIERGTNAADVVA